MLYLHHNLDLIMENNVKQLQRRKESLKINEKLPGPARESKYLGLLYQYLEMFGS